MSFYREVAIISQAASAFLFAAILAWIWFHFVMPAIRTAQEAENNRIAEAQRHLDEARAAIAILHLEIEGAKRDATAIRGRAAEQARHEREALLAEARDAGERSLHNAEGELERARHAARLRLRTYLLDKALEIARGEAGRRVDATLNRTLIDGFVATLERRGG